MSCCGTAFVAIEKSCVKCLKGLKIDCKKKNEENTNLLTLAVIAAGDLECSDEGFECLKFIIKKASEQGCLDASDKNNLPAIIFSLLAKNYKVTKELVMSGVNLFIGFQINDNKVVFPLLLTLEGEPAGLRSLLAHKDNVKSQVELDFSRYGKWQKGYKPIHYCSERDLRDHLEILLEHECKYTAVDSKGNYALHYAAKNNAIKCIEKLLKLDFDINALNEQGESPLELAVKGEHLHAVEILANRATVTDSVLEKAKKCINKNICELINRVVAKLASTPAPLNSISFVIPDGPKAETAETKSVVADKMHSEERELKQNELSPAIIQHDDSEQKEVKIHKVQSKVVSQKNKGRSGRVKKPSKYKLKQQKNSKATVQQENGVSKAQINIPQSNNAYLHDLKDELKLTSSESASSSEAVVLVERELDSASDVTISLSSSPEIIYSGQSSTSVSSAGDSVPNSVSNSTVSSVAVTPTIPQDVNAFRSIAQDSKALDSKPQDSTNREIKLTDSPQTSPKPTVVVPVCALKTETKLAVPPIKKSYELIEFKSYGDNSSRHPPSEVKEILDVLYAYGKDKATVKKWIGIGGGFLRDKLLQKSRNYNQRDKLKEKGPNDYDLRVNLDPLDMVRILKEKFGSDFNCKIVGSRFPVIKILYKTKKIQINPRLYLDTKGCDFTINTLFCSYPEYQLSGDSDAFPDILNPVLRTVGPALDSFNADPVRILRAIYFNAMRDLKWADDIADAIKATRAKLAIESPDRLLTEMLKLVDCGPDILFKALKLMKEHECYKYVFDKIKKVYAENDAVLLFVTILEKILLTGSKAELKTEWNRLETRSAVIKQSFESRSHEQVFQAPTQQSVDFHYQDYQEEEFPVQQESFQPPIFYSPIGLPRGFVPYPGMQQQNTAWPTREAFVPPGFVPNGVQSGNFPGQTYHY